MKYRIKEKVTKLKSNFCIERKILKLFWINLDFWFDDNSFNTLEKAREQISYYIQGYKDKKVIKKIIHNYYDKTAITYYNF